MVALTFNASHKCSIRLRTRSFPNSIDKRPQIGDTKTYCSWYSDVVWNRVRHLVCLFWEAQMKANSYSCGIIAIVRTILTGNLSGAETDYTCECLYNILERRF